MTQRWRPLREIFSRNRRGNPREAVLNDDDAAIQRGLQALGVKTAAQLERETWEREYMDWYNQWCAQQTQLQKVEWDKAYVRWRGEYMAAMARQQQLRQHPGAVRAPNTYDAAAAQQGAAAQVGRPAPPLPQGSHAGGHFQAPPLHAAAAHAQVQGHAQRRTHPAQQHFTPLEKMLMAAAILMIICTLVDAGWI